MGACFFLFSTSTSLGIYTTAQLASHIAPLRLVSTVETFAVVTTVVAYLVTIVSFLSVLFMWLRKYQAFKYSLVTLCFLAFAMIGVVIWSALTHGGTYADAMSASFNTTRVHPVVNGQTFSQCPFLKDSLIPCCAPKSAFCLASTQRSKVARTTPHHVAIWPARSSQTSASASCQRRLCWWSLSQ